MSKKDVSSNLQESAADKKATANSWGNFKRTGKITLYTRRFFRRPSAVVGLVLLVFLILLALFGSKISKWGYDEPDFTALATPPSAEHWLGTTPGGSDMYAMVVRGLGRSLSIGIVSSISITIIAALVGTAISFFEGWFEQVGM